MKRPIIFEHFKEKSPRVKSRVWDIIQKGHVRSCATCGAFTQTSKKRSRRAKKSKGARGTPWDGKCHKCGGVLCDLSRFAKVRHMQGSWLYIRNDNHIPGDGNTACKRGERAGMFLQLQPSLNLRAPSNAQAITDLVSKYVGRPVKNGEYCTICGDLIVSWHLQANGSLEECLKQGSMLMEWLTGTGGYPVITFLDRAEKEGVPLELFEEAQPEPPKTKRRLTLDDLVIDRREPQVRFRQLLFRQ